jgi:PfaD family protein
MRMTPALVCYRVKGIHEDHEGQIITPNMIIAKVSRIEIARQFFSPPPEKLINLLLERGMITPREARLSQSIPMAQDLTAEADSGGHTDNRPALTLLPTMTALKDEFMEKYHYQSPLCVGLAGGIATPESAAAAFGMGAAYILTGSINQSCIEADICEDVKKLLCQAQQADVAMAPAADMFEIGARVQVLKRGTLFPVRAEKLYKLFRSHDNFEDIDEGSKKEIQEKILQASFEDAWASTRAFFQKTGNTKEIERAEKDPKHKMALVFRSYLGLSSKWAIQGDFQRKMDYQIWCGPAIGAFNQWVKGSFLETHENRRVAEIALNLLFGACICIRGTILRTQGIELPTSAMGFRPLPEREIFASLRASV